LGKFTGAVNAIARASPGRDAAVRRSLWNRERDRLREFREQYAVRISRARGRGRLRIDSLQEWALKMNLKVSQGTGAFREEESKVFYGLQERIALSTGRGLLLSREQAPQAGEFLSQPLQQMITGLQRKGQRP
jgi:hypothetical protein